MRTAGDVLAERIDRFGPVPFDDVMEIALYDAEVGFFATTGAAGRRGDFITSPEVGPLFGAVLANAFDGWWNELGNPDPFVVVDAGAGAGTLARTVVAAAPACAGALTYLLVERSDALREQHARGLPLVPPAFAFPPTALDEDGASMTVDRGTGPRVVSLEELPASPFSGVVVANELLDNLPFRMLERADDGWREVLVGRTGAGSPTTHPDQHFSEIITVCPPDLADLATSVGSEVAVGQRIPLQRTAAAWVDDALARLTGGRLVVIDYAASTGELAGRDGRWLRTFRAHERGASPLDDLGLQDITADVAIDQLARVRRPTTLRSQADFLRSHGIDRLVDEGRAIWHERGAIGDLDAIRGRSRVREAEALLDPAGLGAFTVLEWVVSP